MHVKGWNPQVIQRAIIKKPHANNNRIEICNGTLRERVKIFAVNETGITIAGMQAFLFIAYEPFEDRILVSIGFDTSEMGGSMTEVLAHGTAVVVEPDSTPPQPVSLH